MAGVFDGQFVDVSTCYLTTNGGLFKTTDGGKTFTRTSNTGGMAAGLFFLDKNNGWYSTNLLNKTQDGGTSFLPGASTLPIGEYAIQFTDQLHGWIAGNGNAFRTTDGGVTLTTMIPSSHGGDIQFFDNNNGYVLADGKIFSTNDGGITLTKLCAIHKGILFEIHFTDPDHGWSAGGGLCIQVCKTITNSSYALH